MDWRSITNSTEICWIFGEYNRKGFFRAFLGSSESSEDNMLESIWKYVNLTKSTNVFAKKIGNVFEQKRVLTRNVSLTLINLRDDQYYIIVGWFDTKCIDYHIHFLIPDLSSAKTMACIHQRLVHILRSDYEFTWSSGLCSIKKTNVTNNHLCLQARPHLSWQCRL